MWVFVMVLSGIALILFKVKGQKMKADARAVDPLAREAAKLERQRRSREQNAARNADAAASGATRVAFSNPMAEAAMEED